MNCWIRISAWAQSALKNNYFHDSHKPASVPSVNGRVDWIFSAHTKIASDFQVVSCDRTKLLLHVYTRLPAVGGQASFGDCTGRFNRTELLSDVTITSKKLNSFSPTARLRPDEPSEARCHAQTRLSNRYRQLVNFNRTRSTGRKLTSKRPITSRPAIRWGSILRFRCSSTPTNPVYHPSYTEAVRASVEWQRPNRSKTQTRFQ